MSGTQPENDGIIPQKSLTVWDGMGKTRNVQKRESVDIKRSGNMEERRESYNNNFKSCFPHRPEVVVNQQLPDFLCHQKTPKSLRNPSRL